jgi:hypothetical protein
MGGLRRCKVLIAWVAILALLGNFLGGFSSATLAQGSASDYPVDLLGPLVICSEHGAQTAPPDDGTAPEGPGKHCPMCLAAAVFAFIALLAAAALLAPLGAGRRVTFQFGVTFADCLRRPGLGSRAPPLPA